jgi:tRNA nucleotidyltransferase (CCA-adding enzyme)
LESWSRPLLLLVSLHSDRVTRRQIWHYLTRLSQVTSPLNGKDLQQLGYAPGKQFREILGQLRGACLDRLVGDRTEAITWVKTHYPPQSPVG